MFWKKARKFFEGSGEMALVVETAFVGDFRK